MGSTSFIYLSFFFATLLALIAIAPDKAQRKGQDKCRHTCKRVPLSVALLVEKQVLHPEGPLCTCFLCFLSLCGGIFISPFHCF